MLDSAYLSCLYFKRIFIASNGTMDPMYRAIFFSVIVLLSVGCDGGAPLSPSVPSADGAQSVNDSSGVNQGMEGMLFTTMDDRLWKVNLFTGEVSWHGDTYFPDDGNENYYYSLARFAVSASYSSEGGFVVGVVSCPKNIIVDSLTESCAVFYDKKPRYIERIKFNFDAFGPKESWDRKYLAVQSTELLDKSMYFFSMDDLSRTRVVKLVDQDTLLNFKWGPDGKLYYVHLVDPIHQIKYIHPTNPDLDGWIDFPVPPGTTRSIRFSHDGRKYLLLHYNSEINRREIYVGDFLDPNSIRRVVYAGQHVHSLIYNTEWSADGKWVIFQLGKLRNGWVEGIDYTNLLAVSADASNVKVDYLDNFESNPSVIRINTDSWEAFPFRSGANPKSYRWYGNNVYPLAHY